MGEENDTREGHAPNQALYRTIFEMAHDGICVVDAYWKIVLANHRLEELVGAAAGELIGKSLVELVHSSWQRVARTYLDAYGPSSPTSREIEVVLRDGTRRWLRFAVRANFDVNGRFGGADIFIVDLTAMHVAQKALDETRKRLMRALEVTRTQVFEHDLELRYTLLYNGFSGIDPIGKRDDELLSAEDADVAMRIKREVLATGRPMRQDVSVKISGQERHSDMFVEPIFGADGKATGIRAVTVDITNRKIAEAERRKLDEKMREAQKLESLGMLAAGIAHDFNNFLTGILGHAEMLTAELPKNSSHHMDAQFIRTAANRAADLCKQLLAYAGKDRLSTSVVDLPELVREMAQLLDVAISKSIEIRYDFADDLPAIEGDKVQIRQLVMNLMTNASEAIGDTSGKITVSARAVDVDQQYLRAERITENLTPGRYLCFSVEDTGCGMDEATCARIFDPFFTTKLMGRGLGLPSVLSIVRRHHGALQIRSELGRGSVFKVLLPGSDAEARFDDDSAAPRGQWQGSGTILLVDDEEAICTVGKRLLERLGFSVVTGRDGREALKVFQEKKHDIVLVLLDMMMPHLDGAETFAELRRLDPRLPIVMTSGYGEQGVLDWFDPSEPLQFIQKPFRADEFAEKIRSALALRK